ncbi:hypothetical protein [Pseudonocardia charpentierae]|jgi:hypothetical protein|uniref:Uncharacterized protein n=1 Tax=Pseudonocardia charpentierae TaxID=3075545 RepID=A0ABU2N878_9PSEU|nr:hypothetical protein [Pseudonocardia sp. DSM 45834]MDT0350151.1 hypothetical protein [Pseudonocardia sp. DSM 45834]
MTQSHNPPIDPDTVAEIAPGEGPGAGSVEYGGSEIHADGAGSGAGSGADTAGGGGAVTTEAGTFEDLPPGEEDQGE